MSMIISSGHVHGAQTHNHDENAYERIDEVELQRLSLEHAWIVKPIHRASSAILDLPFFHWVRGLKKPIDFKPAAVQLYYHSATFPKVMGLMLGLTSMRENPMMPFYSKHAFGEADHHMMLMRWMLQHGILNSAAEIEDVTVSIETNACVNLAYQLAMEQDRDKWLVAINSGIERCSNDFFKIVAPTMHKIGAGDKYFDIHVEADEHHSIMGLKHLSPLDPSSRRAKQLVSKALEGISLWAGMLHSWIGLQVFPHFDLEGNVIPAQSS
ncbi:MAG TPA: iron-containing redox enzyme family protein, partial [Polyangiaceae bacterium]|nr:iron-containing redox enzyme family protein [Polyangiaceae bacterium]